MKVRKSDVIDGLVIFEPDVFYDNRGEYVEIFNYNDYNFLPKEKIFVQDSFSISRKNTIRGVHGDYITWKLISCLVGEFMLAVIDLRKESSSYLNVETFYLNEKNRKQILIPSGCGNGHVCYSEQCLFFYKQSDYYHGANTQFTISYDSINVDWGINCKPILSERDKMGINLNDFINK